MASTYRVAIFLSDEITSRRLQHAFQSYCLVETHPVTDVGAADGILSDPQLLAVVVDARGSGAIDALVKPAIQFIKRVHDHYPTIPVIGYVDFTPQQARDIFAVAQAGAREIILREFDDLHAVARRIYHIGLACRLAELVVQRAAPYVSRSVQELIRLCVTHAQTLTGVDSAAAMMHRTRKTVSNWLRDERLPPPHRIVGWSRLFLAIKLLEGSSEPIERVARELRFMSGTALRNMLRRYTGLGPEYLRTHGGFDLVLDKFVENLTASRSANVSPTHQPPEPD